MIVRSIYQLPEADISELSSAYMEASILNDSANTITSKKIEYDNIRSDIVNSTSANIVSQFSMVDASGNPISLSSLRTDVTNIKSNNFTFNGIKTFNRWPAIRQDDLPDDNSQYGDNFTYLVPNVGIVKQMVDDNVIFMSTTSSLVAEGNPLPHHQNPDVDPGIPESLDYANTIGSGKFYYWQIDDGQNDSSQSIHDSASGSKDGYEEMRDTGNLVVWGWLADNGTPAPKAEYCWVALYAAMKCEGYDTTQTVDVPICVKPWIRGQYASTMQYISFNVPVKKGLRLKIKTGFPVKQTPGSGFQSTGTMTFIDGWVPNAFFGYVIK